VCSIMISCVSSDLMCDYHVLAEWSQLQLKDSSISEPQHNIVSSVRRFGDNLYISVPRWKSGVEFTLTSLNLLTGSLAPVLQPFPSPALNKIGHCQALQNVDAIEIDPSGRLWIADSGQTAPFSDPDRKCPPKLIIWDLKNNKELVHHLLPSPGQPLFKQMVVDISLGLKNTFAYISDFNSGAMFIYSLSSNTSWVISNTETLPANNEFNIGQFQPFYLRAGLYGLALIPGLNTPTQTQVLGSRLSQHIYTCPASQLGDKGNSEKDIVEDFMVEKPGFAGGLTSTRDGVVYLFTLDTSTLYSLNTTDIESGWTKECQLPQQYLWMDSPNFDEEGNLIVVSNRFHDFTRNNIKISSEPTFSILSIPLDQQNYMTRHVQYSSQRCRYCNSWIFIIAILYYMI